MVDKIGNGTTANLKVFQYMNPMGNMSTRLMAAQIIDFVEFVAENVDFDAIPDAVEEDF